MQPAEAAAPAEPVVPAPTDAEPSFFLELRMPLGRFERRRVESGASEEMRSLVDAGPIYFPSARVWFPLAPWLAWGGELSGGFSSSQVDGSAQRVGGFASLVAQLRLTPWQPSWGQPYLSLGVGGLFWSGPYIDTNTSSPSLTALLPQGTADLGALLWLVPRRWGVDLAGGAGYAFGPGWSDPGGTELFVQRLTFELAVGLVVAL